MTNLFEGLFLYEVILMILGTALFCVMLFLIIKSKEINKNQLAGLGIAIVMIAFPSIKSFSISDGIIKIEKDLEDLKENPEDATTQKKLEQEVSSIGDRPLNNPENLTTLSEANLELGKKERAATLAKEALEKAPDNLKAKEVVNVIEVEEKIKSLKSNPDDSIAKKELQQNIEQLKKIPTESGRRTSQIAAGYEVLGDDIMVKAYIDSTRMYQPKHPIIKKYESKAPLDPGQ